MAYDKGSGAIVIVVPGDPGTVGVDEARAGRARSARCRVVSVLARRGHRLERGRSTRRSGSTTTCGSSTRSSTQRAPRGRPSAACRSAGSSRCATPPRGPSARDVARSWSPRPRPAGSRTRGSSATCARPWLMAPGLRRDRDRCGCGRKSSRAFDTPLQRLGFAAALRDARRVCADASRRCMAARVKARRQQRRLRGRLRAREGADARRHAAKTTSIVSCRVGDAIAAAR